MDKEQWKNEVVNSLQGIRRAEPGPFLFTRIEAAISTRVREVSPFQWKVAIALGLALLLVNGWAIVRDQRSNEGAGVPSAYQLNDHNYQLY